MRKTAKTGKRKRLIKTDTPGLYRDKKSNAIINKNEAELKSYLHQRQNIKRVKALEHELEELKGLIKGLINKNVA